MMESDSDGGPLSSNDQFPLDNDARCNSSGLMRWLKVIEVVRRARLVSGDLPH